MKSITKVLFLAIFLSCNALFADYDFSHNETNYKIVTTKKNWINAAADAVAKGGKLVEINNAAEQTAIENAIAAALTEQANIFTSYMNETQIGDGGNIAYIWIGASDKTSEGDWCWDGENSGAGTAFWTGIDSTGSAINNAYNNWGKGITLGEPDNSQSAQHVAAIGLTDWTYGNKYQWNDIRDDHELFYIVEMESQGGGGGDDETGDTETHMTRNNLVYEIINGSDDVIVSEVKDAVTGNVVTIPATISRGAGETLEEFTVIGINYDDENDKSPFDGKGMTEVIFSEGIENDIYNGGFNNCQNLEKLTFSAAMTRIPEVKNCPKFTEYIVPEESNDFFSIDGVLFEKSGNDKAELAKYPPARIGVNYAIPEKVTTINIGVFSNVLLNTLTIGKDIEHIDFDPSGTPINNFAKILVHSENIYFKSIDGVLYDSEGDLFLFPNRLVETTFTATNGNFYFNDYLNSNSVLKTLTITGESTNLTVSDFSVAFKEIYFTEGRPRFFEINYKGSDELETVNPDNGPTIFISTEKLSEWGIEESSNPITILDDNNVPVNVSFYTPKKYSVIAKNGILEGEFSSFSEGSIVSFYLNEEEIPLNKMFQFWSVSPKDVTLTFQNETNFTTPSIEFIMPKTDLIFTPVFINQTTSSISVSVLPSREDKNFNESNFQWSSNGGKTWLEANVAFYSSPGTYTIMFRSIALNWAPPASRTVVVSEGEEIMIEVLSQYIPTISAVSGSNGTVKMTPEDGRLLPEKNIVITATANKDYIFSNWAISDAKSNITNAFSAKVTITSVEDDLTYTATFEKKINPTVLYPTITNEITNFAINVGIPFFLQLETDVRPVTFSITSGKLVSGLKLDKNTGIISGVPTKVGGLSNIKFLAKNVNNLSSALNGKELSFTINKLPDEIVQNFIGLIYGESYENVEKNFHGLIDYTINSLGKITGKTFTQRGTFAFKSQLQQDENGTFYFNYSDKNQVFKFIGTEAIFSQLGNKVNLNSKSYKNTISSGKKYYTFAGMIDDESTTYPVQNHENIPEGAIFGTITTDLRGKAKISIILADGTVANVAGKISENLIVFFSPINGKTGFFAGKITILANDEISFNAEWLNQKAKTFQFFTEVNGVGNIYDSGTVKKEISTNISSINLAASVGVDLPSYFYSYKESGVLNLEEIEALQEYLPTDVKINADAKKGLILAKKSLAPWKEPDGSWNYSNAKNDLEIVDPAQTSFSFNLKTGLFNGSFNVYYDYAHSMTEKKIHVTVKVPYKGVMVKDINNENSESTDFVVSGNALMKYNYQTLDEAKITKNPLVRSLMILGNTEK